jgi:hypothetical protein
MKRFVCSCDCESCDHLFQFIDDGEDMWIEVQLNPTHSFFKRVILAIKYIFGYYTKFGHWDCTLIDKQTRAELADFLSGQ